MIAILVGLVFVGVGLWGLIQWFGDFLVVIKGLGPISLLLGGIVGIMAGISSFQSRRKSDGSK